MNRATILLLGVMPSLAATLPAWAQEAPDGLGHLALSPAPLADGRSFSGGVAWGEREPRTFPAAANLSSRQASDLDPLTSLTLLGLSLGLAYGVVGTQALLASWKAPGPRDPALALGLSAGSAASMIGLSYLFRSWGPLSFVGGAAPLGLAVGYAYAGEPERGAMVALGTYGVLVGASVLSWLAYEIVVPGKLWKDPMYGPVTLGIYTGVACTGLYALWSLLDVYQIAQRRQ